MASDTLVSKDAKDFKKGEPQTTAEINPSVSKVVWAKYILAKGRYLKCFITFLKNAALFLAGRQEANQFRRIF